MSTDPVRAAKVAFREISGLPAEQPVAGAPAAEQQGDSFGTVDSSAGKLIARTGAMKAAMFAESAPVAQTRKNAAFEKIHSMCAEGKTNEAGALLAMFVNSACPAVEE